MMKRYIFYIITLMTLVCTSCTQNNGNIGDLFGSWVLEEVTIGGATTNMAQQEPTVFSFQADVVRVTYYADEFYHFNYLGTWTRSDNILDFDFTHHNNETAPGEDPYSAPIWLDFETGVVTRTTITRLDGGHLDFTRIASDGKTYLYKLVKTW